ncbi:hypothetical protein IH922_05655 [candidate division KSB1 bacterium]|nr:hypothetical protein [candidate division KSB1 bacterium]
MTGEDKPSLFSEKRSLTREFNMLKRNILIIDDEPKMCKILRFDLEPDEQESNLPPIPRIRHVAIGTFPSNGLK